MINLGACTANLLSLRCVVSGIESQSLLNMIHCLVIFAVVAVVKRELIVRVNTLSVFQGSDVTLLSPTKSFEFVLFAVETQIVFLDVVDLRRDFRFVERIFGICGRRNEKLLLLRSFLILLNK